MLPAFILLTTKVYGLQCLCLSSLSQNCISEIHSDCCLTLQNILPLLYSISLCEYNTIYTLSSFGQLGSFQSDVITRDAALNVCVYFLGGYLHGLILLITTRA